MSQANDNLFSALRAAFPSDLDAIAIETDNGLNYSWRDLERATAMMANLLKSLALPEGSRVAVQVEKSVEAVMLYLATLRAGYVFLPLNTAYQSAEIEYFIGNAEPAVVVCSPKNFGWVSQLAFKAGTKHVFTLDDNRTGTLLERAAHCSDRHTPVPRRADDLAAILYTSGTTGRSKGAMLTHGNLLSNARVLQSYWGWKNGDVLIHALPIFHVHGLFVALHGALLNGSKIIWMAKFDPKKVIEKLPEATVFMGVPTLYVRMLAEPTLTREAVRNMRLFIAGSAPLLLETFQPGSSARATPPRALRHERDHHADLQSLRPQGWRASWRHRGLPAARREPARGRGRWPDPAHGRDRRHPGQGPQCLQRLLAHAREDEGGIHGRRLLQDRRRGQIR